MAVGCSYGGHAPGKTQIYHQKYVSLYTAGISSKFRFTNLVKDKINLNVVFIGVVKIRWWILVKEIEIVTLLVITFTFPFLIMQP
jgi:hypothetical protein